MSKATIPTPPVGSAVGGEALSVRLVHPYLATT